MPKSMIAGTIAASLAAISWSLSFIVPFVIADYSLFDFALVEFVFSGVMGLAILARHWKAVRLLRTKDWLVACSLGLIGYVGYFLAVMGAALYAGPVVAPAFLSLVPIVLALAGNQRERVVPWSALALPLGLASAGLLLVNGAAFLSSGSLETKSLFCGIPLAMAAVALWTLFGLLNQSALSERPQVDSGIWTALIMVGAGASMLLFFPVGLMLRLFQIPKLGLGLSMAGPLFAWAGGLSIFANVGGAMGWTFASQRLPVALCAQLITIEPISATLLGLWVRRRQPSVAEVAGIVILLAGVMIAIRTFTRVDGLEQKSAARLAGGGSCPSRQ